MKVQELDRDQIIELKEVMLLERNRKKGEGTSYEELANADELISDEEVFKEYAGTEFVHDDFFCSAGQGGIDMNDYKKLYATQIEWDWDERDGDPCLPDEVEIPRGLSGDYKDCPYEPEEEEYSREIVEWLTDQYEFCIRNLILEWR